MSKLIMYCGFGVIVLALVLNKLTGFSGPTVTYGGSNATPAAIVASPTGYVIASTPTATPTPIITPVITLAPTPIPTVAPTPTARPTPIPTPKWKDGYYTGSLVYNNYGPVQVAATIKNANLIQVVFTASPSEAPRSRRITTYSSPILIKEALTIQSNDVDTVSGATLTSEGFRDSLLSALQKAHS